MPYNPKASGVENSMPRYNIRFRGAAMIPFINQMAPCRMNLTMESIRGILESLYRRPLRLEVRYVDENNREWEINYTNYKKILPSQGSKPKSVAPVEAVSQRDVESQPPIEKTHDEDVSSYDESKDELIEEKEPEMEETEEIVEEDIDLENLPMVDEDESDAPVEDEASVETTSETNQHPQYQQSRRSKNRHHR